MNIPITKRVMVAGSRKSCGCCGACNCDASPAKQGAYPKDLKEKIRAASSREESQAIEDNYMDSLYTQRVNKGEKLSRNRQRGWEKIKERQASRKQSPINKKGCGRKSSPAKMGCYGKKK